MTWPFVRRSVYDADVNYLRVKVEAEREVNALLRAELIEQRVEVREANGLVKALLAPILAPILAKQPPKAPAEPRDVTPEEQAWDEVRRVIREQATIDGRENFALAAHLSTYANQLKRDGLTAEQVAGKLVRWQTSELAAEDHT